MIIKLFYSEKGLKTTKNKLLFTGDKPTKKLLRKMDKIVPGFSYVFDPKKIFDLNKNESDLLEFAASFLLMVEKANKTKADRKAFPKLTKQKTLIKQNFCCKDCGEFSKVLEFHHKNGNRADNRLSNCEALCPNCHTKKTRKI